MAQGIHKILYTTDLSENSAHVFRHALNIAERHEATIEIIHVVKEFLSLPDYMIVKSPADDLSDAAREIEKRVQDFVCQELRDNPGRIRCISAIHVVQGNPVQEILRKAGEIKADILILGTHSKGLLYQAFLGSVTREVLLQTRIPVLIVPLPKT